VSATAAWVLPGSVADRVVVNPRGSPLIFSVEHPRGELRVALEVSGAGADFKVGRSGILRTARALFEDQVLIPHSVWGGRP
jgi:2-methylaconitate cis-trans-isomerase PrpF